MAHINHRCPSEDLRPYAIDSKNLHGLKTGTLKGRGSYGVVSKVLLNGAPCIAKRLHDILVGRGVAERISSKEQDGVCESFCHECIFLSKLKHPNIVQFMGVHFGEDSSDLTLVMESLYMDLDQCLDVYPAIPLPIKLGILLDVSYGLLHMHSQTPPILHRDLKAENILLTAGMRAKIADLGVSKYGQDGHGTRCPGTPHIMPPEALMKNPTYDTKLDTFSFGMLTLHVGNGKPVNVYEIAHNEYATALQNGEVQIAKRKDALLQMGKEHCLYSVVIQCLQDDPKKRPTTEQLKKEMEELSMRCPRQFKDVLQMHAELERVYMTLQELQKQTHAVEQLKQALLEKEVENQSMNLQVQYLRGELQDVEKELKSAQEELVLKEQELERAKRSEELLQRTNFAQKTRNASLIKDVQRLQQELGEANARLSGEIQSENADPRAKAADRDAAWVKLREMEILNTQLNEKLENLETDLQRAERKAAKADDMYKQEKRRSGTFERERQESFVQVVEHARVASEKIEACDHLHIENKALSAQIERLVRKNDKLTLENKLLRMEVEKMKRRPYQVAPAPSQADDRCHIQQRPRLHSAPATTLERRMRLYQPLPLLEEKTQDGNVYHQIPD